MTSHQLPPSSSFKRAPIGVPGRSRDPETDIALSAIENLDKGETWFLKNRSMYQRIRQYLFRSYFGTEKKFKSVAHKGGYFILRVE